MIVLTVSNRLGGAGNSGAGVVHSKAFPFADGGKIEGFAGGGIPGFASADGVIHGPGTGTSDSILALVNGRRPILVSNGEAIVNERGVRKHWPLIDAINRDALPRFADGGAVSGNIIASLPRLPSAASLSRAASVSVNMPISVDATGADAAGLARVARSLDELKQSLPSRIVTTVNDAQERRILRV